MRSLLLLALMLPAAATAVPLTLSHQGRLSDSAGLPLEGAHSVTFSLYDGLTAAAPVWTETLPLVLDGGFFAVNLGASMPFSAEVTDGRALFVGLSVDGGDELPRVVVNSTPFAFTALNLRGGVVDASEVQVNGQVVIDGGGAMVAAVDFADLTGLPDDLADGDDDTLADLACAPNQLLFWDGAAWACGDHPTPLLDASQLTGTIDLDQLPVGSGANQVAAGDHAHGFGPITGIAEASQLPIGPGSAQVAAGDHTHGFAQLTGAAAIGQLPVGTPPASTARCGGLNASFRCARAPRGPRSPRRATAAPRGKPRRAVRRSKTTSPAFRAASSGSTPPAPALSGLLRDQSRSPIIVPLSSLPSFADPFRSPTAIAS